MFVCNYYTRSRKTVNVRRGPFCTVLVSSMLHGNIPFLVCTVLDRLHHNKQNENSWMFVSHRTGYHYHGAVVIRVRIPGMCITITLYTRVHASDTFPYS
jgi:hypothetical protein